MYRNIWECIHIWMCICIYVVIYIHMHICVSTYVNICVYVHIYVYMCMCICAFIYAYDGRTTYPIWCIWIYVYQNISEYLSIYQYVHMCTFVYMSSRIYYGNINKDTITLSYFLFCYYIVIHSYCVPALYLLVPTLATGGVKCSQLLLALFHPDPFGQSILTLGGNNIPAVNIYIYIYTYISFSTYNTPQH